MAYAAALGESDPRYYDTARGVLAQPLFPVCYEWPVSLPVRQIPALRDFFPRLVHAEHDLTIHRPAREGDRLQTSVRVRAVEQRKPGAYVVFRFEAQDAAGAKVSTSDFGALYRGVQVDGGDRLPPEGIAQLPAYEGELARVAEIAVAAEAAHVYTECARIWNPIHTDIAHARSAGLPGIILHGTATLALSVSRVLAAFGADPAAVRRVRCRFSGMVMMPSTLAVLAKSVGKSIHFETRNERGEAVVGRGRIDLLE